MSNQIEQQKKNQEKKEKSPEDRVVSAAQATRSERAIQALVSAETTPTAQETEHTPEQQAREIADKYIKMIPEGDRRIFDEEQLEIVLYAIEGTRQTNEEKNIEGAHLTSTTDRLGNLSDPIHAALHNKKSGGEIARIMREFADDPVQHAGEMDKAGIIANSTLPESVRNAMLAIILKEGDQSTQQSMRELANRIENATGEDVMGIIRATRKNMDQGGITSCETDNIRRAALRQFLEGIYPKDVVSRLADLQNMTPGAGFRPIPGESNYEEKKEETIRANTAQLLEKYKDLLGENHSSSPGPGVYPDEFFNNTQREVRDALVQRLLERAAPKLEFMKSIGEQADREGKKELSKQVTETLEGIRKRTEESGGDDPHLDTLVNGIVLEAALTLDKASARELGLPVKLEAISQLLSTMLKEEQRKQFSWQKREKERMEKILQEKLDRVNNAIERLLTP